MSNYSINYRMMYIFVYDNLPSWEWTTLTKWAEGLLADVGLHTVVPCEAKESTSIVGWKARFHCVTIKTMLFTKMDLLGVHRTANADVDQRTICLLGMNRFRPYSPENTCLKSDSSKHLTLWLSAFLLRWLLRDKNHYRQSTGWTMLSSSGYWYTV